MDALRIADAVALAAFASVYLGTGVTLVFFLYPIAPKLTPATYQLPFVEPVQNATRFFTVMTSLMLTGAAGMILLELGTLYWIIPAIYLALVITATLITTRHMFVLNRKMSDGISDPVELQQILVQWRHGNAIRASIWTLEWITIATWWVLRVA
jgi:hypothetical protein